ncbi:NAC domain-containing protein 83-like isoform X2 [Benincasa hispida]|uniref:NAC domain-containing protein 83-like isoform X2 n=1 Tax=Benincasa hispida TaxID=102211 RepID=UPI0019009DF8|nr:NAC domain-containing protein 83-like isoform X2 [Benincasa hispida]
MTPSPVTSSAILDLFSTDKEIFLALRRILSGGPFPANVYDLNPCLFKPENLPVWYHDACNGNADTSFGPWKPKGGDCKLYSDSSFTGWRTTYEYYEGQAPHECKTAWVMQKYWMSQTDLNENSKQKETSSLCKVFLGDAQFQNHEKIQKIELSIILNSKPNNLNHQLVVPDGSTSNDMANGSTSKSEMSEDDKMVELAVAGKPHGDLEEILAVMNDLSEGNYLELLDLDNPTSPSSSENSSCLTMSSDEDFDMMAVLCDIERDINHDRAQRNAACIRTSAPSRIKEEVVHQGASESLVSIKRSHSPAKENPKIDSTASGSGHREPELRLPRQSEKEGYRLKGASSSHNKKISNGQETAVDGGKKKKKKAVGRMKKIQKKYLCFIPF